MKKIKLVAGITALMILSSNAFAGMSAKDVALKVQRLYDGTSTMKADFIQTAKMKTLGITQQDQGIVYMKKDGKIRWEYNKPKQQFIISNGKTLWFYMPSDKQVIIGNFESAFKYKPAQTFLTGMGNLLNDFNVKFENSKNMPGTKYEYLLQLVPKKMHAGAPAKILLAVNKKDYVISKSLVIDKFNNITEIDFSNIELNIALPDNLFDFVPPKDVEIIHSPSLQQ